jgi:hypothetical protein
MAARKPKDIDDQIIGGIRAIMSPWLGTPPAQNKSVTQAQGLARSAAQTLDQTFAGGMIGAGVKGNKALAKQAAVNAAALGAGAAVGYGVSKVAGAVTESGALAQILNKVKAQEVYLHGSPKSGIKQINPTIGANREWSSERGAIGFFENPKASETSPGGMAGVYAGPKGSVYVVKGPKKSFTSDPNNQMVFQNQTPLVAISKQPQKVVSEIKLADVGLSRDARAKAVAEALRKAGYKLPKRR